MLQEDLLIFTLDIHLYCHTSSGEKNTWSILTKSALISDFIVDVGTSDPEHMVNIHIFFWGLVVLPWVAFKARWRKNLPFKLVSASGFFSFCFIKCKLVLFFFFFLFEHFFNFENIRIQNNHRVVLPNEDGFFLPAHRNNHILFLIEQNRSDCIWVPFVFVVDFVKGTGIVE